MKTLQTIVEDTMYFPAAMKSNLLCVIAMPTTDPKSLLGTPPYLVAHWEELRAMGKRPKPFLPILGRLASGVAP